jgi:dipicolinate synthase subunit A
LQGLIIKDDPRYNYVEAYLKNQGVTINDSLDITKELDFVLFPFKAEVDQEIYNGAFFSSLNSNTLIISGLRKSYLEEKCKFNNLKYTVLMEDKDVSIMNAIPTSEGVISYIIENTIMPVFGSKILVIGYGICGRDLGMRLAALNADVYALVRNDVKEAMAIRSGVTPVYIDELKGHSFDVIVNTVPNKILSKEDVQRYKDVLTIDISSKPHGFDIEYIEGVNDKFVILPGIPSKCAVKFAGEILGKNIYKKVSAC